MVRATTPTFKLTISSRAGDPIDFSLARNIYVTIQQGSTIIELSNDDIKYDGNVISIFLPQNKSIKLTEKEAAKIQVNWTYYDEDGKTILRAATNVGRIMISEQLLQRVLE